MTLVLSERELQRIRASVAVKKEDNAAALRKKELKEKSDARLKNWPNTLDALRKKKESFLKDREEREEAKRQEIDREEAEIRRTQRLESIQKANELLYDQTDKMKMLKSQQLYADVLHTRISQKKEKQTEAEKEREYEIQHHLKIMDQVAKGEMTEKEKAAQRVAEMEKIKKARADQREEARQRKEAERLKNIEIGLRMKEQAKANLEEDEQNFQKKQQQIAESNARNVAANEELRRIKAELLQKEKDAEAERDAAVAEIDARKKGLKALEKKRFEKAQVTRQKMIERAVDLLATQTNTAQAIMEKQEQDVRDKEDQRMAAKEAKLKADWEETVRSRTMMTKAKEERYMREMEEDDRLAQKFKRENEEAIEREKQKERDARQKVVELKQIQREEARARREKAERERAIEVEQAKISLNKNDDDRFTERAKDTIERYVKEGKPVYTLIRALEYTEPQLLAAKKTKDAKKVEE